MAKPDDGRFMISTRTEEELRVARVAAAGLGVIGAGLVIAGLLA